MKRVLVPMLGVDGDRAALTAAAAVASPVGGHVEARLFSRDPRDVLPIVGEGFSAAMIEQLLASAEARAKEQQKTARASFDAFKKASPDLSADFEQIIGPLPGSLTAPGRLADVIVFARDSKDENPDRASLIETAVMEAGRPVLLNPAIAPDKVGGHVLVAWNGSAEAARAVAMTMPMLARAQVVTVVTVEDGDASIDPAALARTLTLNGITATSSMVAVDREGVAATLEAEAKKVGADMIVIGAYSHSRIREFVMGGVTDDALTDGSVPILLAR
ncbi:MAG: universal stress protein [Alphaproteobacteria bacterium]|nr:universal stress protein [Alphaproteobacteria bacterium]